MSDKESRFLLDPSTSFLYTGRELDSETGLYYNRARFYDPQLGRFITTDPKGYKAGLNLYTYTRNNPLSFNDPLGLDVGCSGGGYYYGGFWGAVSGAARSVANAVSSAAHAVSHAVSTIANAVASTVAHVASAIASGVSKAVNAITGSGEKAKQAEENPSIPIPPPARKEGETEQQNLLELFDKMDKNLSPPNDDDNNPPTGPEDIINLALKQAGLIPTVQLP